MPQTWEEWVTVELILLAFACTIGIPLGTLLHHLLARHFGWQFDKETQRWN